MSFYRSAIWFAKGMREYTKSGYERAAAHFNPTDLNADLSNRAIMITGANSGIGKSTAIEVAKRGATVYMICRSKERGEAAVKEVMDLTSNKVIG